MKKLILSFLLVFGTIGFATTDVYAKPHCEEAGDDCHDDCKENYDYILFRGSCHLGCEAGELACEIFL